MTKTPAQNEPDGAMDAILRSVEAAENDHEILASTKTISLKDLLLPSEISAIKFVLQQSAKPGVESMVKSYRDMLECAAGMLGQCKAAIDTLPDEALGFIENNDNDTPSVWPITKEMAENLRKVKVAIETLLLLPTPEAVEVDYDVNLEKIHDDLVPLDAAFKLIASRVEAARLNLKEQIHKNRRYAAMTGKGE